MAYIPDNPYYPGLTNFDPMSIDKLPTYFDINGQQHYNYATVYGPHSGKACDCAECKQFNEEFSNRAEQMKLMDKVHAGIEYAFRRYYMNSPSGYIGVNDAMQIAANVCGNQIAEYQKEMVTKVQKIQLEHTARIERIMSQQNKMAEVRMKRDMEKRKAGEHEGRLFRVGEQEETE